MNDRIFKTQGEVLDYLHSLGLKISRAKLSKDYRAGILCSEPDKTFHESNVAVYAESLKAPDFRPEAIGENAQGRQLRRMKAMVLDFCAAIPDVDAIATALAKWLEKDGNDPEVAQKLAICQRRVARRIAKRQETEAARFDKNVSEQPTQNEAEAQPDEHPEYTLDCMALYWRKRNKLTPDQIKLPEIPGGYDKIDTLDPNARFCLTGIFAYGERGDCERLVKNMGGKVAKWPVLYEQTYVVVGTLASPEWSCGLYGNKIDLGIKYRAQGAPLKIITEDNWIELVLASERENISKHADGEA